MNCGPRVDREPGSLRGPVEVFRRKRVGLRVRLQAGVGRRVGWVGSQKRTGKLLSCPAFRGRESPLASARGVD